MKAKNNIDADVIVIGSGAGGGFVATALAEAGKSVLLLERGKWYDYKKDFPARYPDWQSRGSAFRIGSFFSDPTLSFQKGAAIKPEDFDPIRIEFNLINNQFSVTDGFHRIGVFKERGIKMINAEVVSKNHRGRFTKIGLLIPYEVIIKEIERNRRKMAKNLLGFSI